MMSCRNLVPHVRCTLPFLLCALAACAVAGVDRGNNVAPSAVAPVPDGSTQESPDASPDTPDAAPDGLADASDAHAFDASADASPEPQDHEGGPGLDASEPEATDASTSVPDASDEAHADASEPHDAAPVVITRTLDGVLDPEEWRDAASASQSVASDWGPNQLTYVAAALDDTYLWLAVRGSVESDKNALVVYLDSEAGVGVAPHGITDQSGEDELDDALSAGLSVPAGFLADYAWGTLRMGTNVRGASAQTGFRGLENPGDLAWVDAPPPPVDEHSAHTICLVDTCEMRIPLATLGGTGAIRLFARVTNSDGETFANQTLPLDDSAAPATVHTLLTVER